MVVAHLPEALFSEFGNVVPTEILHFSLGHIRTLRATLCTAILGQKVVACELGVAKRAVTSEDSCAFHDAPLGLMVYDGRRNSRVSNA
jgi:hypothetical protein